MAKVRKGLADVTDGEKWEWLGSGKTSFTGERKLDMSYGISTTIEASLASKLSVGISTSVAMEAAVKAEFGAGLSYTKGEALSLSLCRFRRQRPHPRSCFQMMRFIT